MGCYFIVTIKDVCQLFFSKNCYSSFLHMLVNLICEFILLIDVYGVCLFLKYILAVKNNFVRKFFKFNTV